MKHFRKTVKIAALLVGILWLISGFSWLEAVAFILLLLIDL